MNSINNRKISKYVLTLEEKSKKYLYNLSNGKLIEILKNVGCSEEVERILYENNFLMETDSQVMRKVENNRILGLTINITNKCNMKCEYCYNNKNTNLKGSGFKVSNLINSLESYIVKEKKIETINVNYIGGEPLLDISKIIEIQKSILKISKKNKINIMSSITTNGVYLTPQIVKELKKVDIINYQVTLDGPEVRHNYYRKTNLNNDTFKKIINNIKKNKKNANIVVRINFDENINVNEYKELLIELKNQEILYIYFAHIEKDGKFIDEKKIHIYKELWEIQYGLGLPFIKIYPPIIGACGAKNKKSFTLDTDGNIYRCQCFIGEGINEKVSSLNEGFKKQEIEFLNKCKNCKYFPICLGGCIHYSKGEEEGCGFAKNYSLLLKKYIKYRYNIKEV